MEENLQHEDLLIKLRGKLNEEKIKLWEPPYLGTDDLFTQSFQVPCLPFLFLCLNSILNLVCPQCLYKPLAHAFLNVNYINLPIIY